VDAEAQVIVAHGLDANGSDQHQLTPMVDAVEANMGRVSASSARASSISSNFVPHSASLLSCPRSFTPHFQPPKTHGFKHPPVA